MLTWLREQDSEESRLEAQFWAAWLLPFRPFPSTRSSKKLTVTQGRMLKAAFKTQSACPSANTLPTGVITPSERGSGYNQPDGHAGMLHRERGRPSDDSHKNPNNDQATTKQHLTNIKGEQTWRHTASSAKRSAR